MALGEKVLTTARALGDETRFSIYSHIQNHNGPINIEELADHFNLHPNAVRLHVHKLEEANLITSNAAKSAAGGGRPRRLYSAGIKPIEIMLPDRNFRLLAQLLAGLVGKAGMTAEEIEKFGAAWGAALAAELPSRDYDEPQLASIVQSRLEDWGLGPAAESRDGRAAVLTVTNCVFKEVAQEFPGVICRLVHSVIEGLVGGLAPRYECDLDNGIARGGNACRIHIFLPTS